MLNIYLMRENIDKNKIIFTQIESTYGNKVLIVPDQYTLASEKNSFKYLNKSAVIDLEILSPSRLGYKILKETGKPKELPLDKYGRQMLLYSIMQKNTDKLKHFTKLAGKSSFIELLDEQLGEFQQYFIDSNTLNKTIAKLDEKSVLYQKLSDLAMIYAEYEKELAEKYIDTKDINEIFIQRIKSSDFVANTNFWISEYDYMAPKNLEFLIQIAARGKNVNIILSGDINPKARDIELFDITKKFIYKLKKSCDTIGIEYKIIQISDKHCEIEKNPDLKNIESEIFSYPIKSFASKSSAIHLKKSKNIYTEAETAAVYIRKLLAEKKYKFSDIAVICNDIDSLGPIVKRTFQEYKIKCFLDKNRDVHSNILVSLNLTLLQIARSNLTTSAVIAFLKSGFSPLSRDEAEKLENYCKKYKIKGNMWLKDFYKTDSTAKFEPSLDEINSMRDKVISPLSKFRTKIQSETSATEKIKTLYNFIKEDLKVAEKLKIKIKEYENSGFTESALENAQIWDTIINLYEQLVLILKDDEIEIEDIEEILKSGFSNIKIGMIPSTEDEILIGNMQRSRIGQIPVLLILAANEGILPLSNSNDNLINDDEKIQILNICGFEFGEMKQNKLLEENLAIYRMLCAPTDELFISYEQNTQSGDTMKPSQIFLRLAEIFTKNDVKNDIYAPENYLDLLTIPEKAMLNIASKLRDEQDLTEAETMALFWCHKNAPDTYAKLTNALKFEVRAAKLSKGDTKNLYLNNADTMSLSPSRLEKFAACPFAYFLSYGIKPVAESKFELSAGQFGDIYHSVTQKISETLSSDNLKLSDPNSKWQTITNEELISLIDDIIAEETRNYQNGFLFDEADGSYKIKRIRNVCHQVIFAIISQIRAGQIQEILCETIFGNRQNATFPAISISGEPPIIIEGKIDRVDLLDVDGKKYCKIIDYKSGITKFDKDDIIAGFQLQLAIYLTAASNGLKDTKPAGMFYFHFSDKKLLLSANSQSEISDQDLLKEYKLDGIFLDSENVINALDSNFSRFSKIANIQRTKDGIKKNEKHMINEIEFKNFLSSVNSIILKLCKSLTAGDISIYPAKTSNGNACEFCEYTSICKFDKSLPNCNYRKKW
ncbi:MAG: PD-(D/E)XK nuclease family protein [Eubacteriales bacterium]